MSQQSAKSVIVGKCSGTEGVREMVDGYIRKVCEGFVRQNQRERTCSGKSEEKLPPEGQSVWVECGGYRTLAYHDIRGLWRSVAKGEVLVVTKVLWDGE